MPREDAVEDESRKRARVAELDQSPIPFTETLSGWEAREAERITRRVQDIDSDVAVKYVNTPNMSEENTDSMVKQVTALDFDTKYGQYDQVKLREG